MSVGHTEKAPGHRGPGGTSGYVWGKQHWVGYFVLAVSVFLASHTTNTTSLCECFPAILAASQAPARMSLKSAAVSEVCCEYPIAEF